MIVTASCPHIRLKKGKFYILFSVHEVGKTSYPLQATDGGGELRKEGSLCKVAPRFRIREEQGVRGQAGAQCLAAQVGLKAGPTGSSAVRSGSSPCRQGGEL